MFGTDVVSDWKQGSTIVWKGEYKGKKYEDKGVIFKLEQNQTLQYSHFSPLSGKPDVPENYHCNYEIVRARHNHYAHTFSRQQPNRRVAPTHRTILARHVGNSKEIIREINQKIREQDQTISYI